MATNEALGSGIHDARVKLDVLLKDLVKKSEESSEDEVIASLGSSLSYSMPPPSTPTKRKLISGVLEFVEKLPTYTVLHVDFQSWSSSGKTPRKRRKKETGFEEAEGVNQNPSFVRKLFDRSVDFAQFNEDTPLYALARAWMQNKPYGTKSSDSQDYNTDGDSPSNSQEHAVFVPGHSNGDNNPKNVYSFPDPVKTNEESEPDCVLPNTGGHGPLTLDIHYDLEKAPSLQELKRSHIDRWKKVKDSWREYSFKKQTRYAPSIRKIRQLFEHQ